MSTESKGSLFIVATPVGNPEDITLRAINTLKGVDFVICEEFKNGSRLLKSLEINKPLELLNEHNEREQTGVLLNRLISGESAALISDAGTPLFADPGNSLVAECHVFQVSVYAVPGASSLMSILMISGLKLDKFLYYGFLPANRKNRLSEIRKLPDQYDLILMETPYRLQQLLSDIVAVKGTHRNGMIGYKLTMPEEKLFRGSLGEIKKMTENLPKGEFVLILEKSGRK